MRVVISSVLIILRYIGQYLHGKKHGKGVFVWPDGRKYDGDWAEGRRHGRGRFTNGAGETRSGTWAADKPVGWDPAGVERAVV